MRNYLERNGPILFVKAFAIEEALEIECNLTAIETYALKNICPDYSVTCVNKEGKNNKRDMPEFKQDSSGFNYIVIMGKQASKMIGVEHKDWSKGLYHLVGDNFAEIHFVPSLSRISSSKRHIQRMRDLVKDIKKDIKHEEV